MIGVTVPVHLRLTPPSHRGMLVLLAMPSGAQRRLDAGTLIRRDLHVAVVRTLAELRNAMVQFRPDVTVVDGSIVAGDLAHLLDLVRSIRGPLIAVSVRDPSARADVLLAGAEDCLPVAYTSEELTARVIAVARRAFRARPLDDRRILRVGPVQLDLRARRVELHGQHVALTAMEFNLLDCFLRHPGEALSRARLLAEVWGYTGGGSETVTVHVRRLRAKVESDPARPELIETVWGVGYRFCAQTHHDYDRAVCREPAVSRSAALALAPVVLDAPCRLSAVSR